MVYFGMIKDFLESKTEISPESKKLILKRAGEIGKKESGLIPSGYLTFIFSAPQTLEEYLASMKLLKEINKQLLSGDFILSALQKGKREFVEKNTVSEER